MVSDTIGNRIIAVGVRPRYRKRRDVKLTLSNVLSGPNLMECTARRCGGQVFSDLDPAGVEDVEKQMCERMVRAAREVGGVRKL